MRCASIIVISTLFVFTTLEFSSESNITIEDVNGIPYLLWWRDNLWPIDHLSIDSYIILIERKYRKTAVSVTKFAISNLDFYNLSSIVDSNNSSHDRECMEILIVAINASNGSLPEPVPLSKRYPSGESHQNETILEAEVLSIADGNTLLKIDAKVYHIVWPLFYSINNTIMVQLPTVCPYEDVEYTFIIENATGVGVECEGCGPFRNTGSGNVSHVIHPNLEWNTTYSVRMEVTTPLGANPTTDKYSFCKSLQHAICIV